MACFAYSEKNSKFLWSYSYKDSSRFKKSYILPLKNEYLFFLFTGYGNLVPRTTNGRLFCIFYAFLGIPIACLALKSIAERIMLMEVFLIKVMWKYFSKKDQVRSVHFKSIILNFLLTVTAVLLLAFMANIKRREWSYFECIYFSFITFTTIGFGDYIPTYGEAFSEYDILIVAISFFVGFTLVSCLLCSVSYALEEHSRSVLRRAKSTIEHSKMGRARSRTLDMATCDTTLSSNDGVKTCHVSRDNETGVTLQKFSDVKEDPE